MNRLQYINAFIHVVEESSFVGAAKRLAISTAAISRHVSSLEKYLGVQLLKRTTRRISLTAIGIEYYQLCKTTLMHLVEAEHNITRDQKEVVGELCIHATRFLALSLILPKMPKFLAENPKLKINIEIAERFPDFMKEGVDILFGVSMDGPQELVRRRIMMTRYVLCASPKYLKKYGHPKSPNDLHKHIYITHSMRKPVDLITFKDGNEIYLEPLLRVNDIAAMRQCALQGMGIVKVQEYEIKEALEKGELIEILKEFRTSSYPVYLYYHQCKYMPAKIRRFIDFYLELN